jgi:hypothetical protein
MGVLNEKRCKKDEEAQKKTTTTTNTNTNKKIDGRTMESSEDTQKIREMFGYDSE